MELSIVTIEERDLITERRLTSLETKLDGLERSIKEVKEIVEKYRPALYLVGAGGPILTSLIVWFLTHKF